MEQVMVEKLIDTAIEQLKFSYTPYSNFKVGAALLTKSGKIYTGCNIEKHLIHQQTVRRELHFLRR